MHSSIMRLPLLDLLASKVASDIRRIQRPRDVIEHDEAVVSLLAMLYVTTHMIIKLSEIDEVIKSLHILQRMATEAKLEFVAKEISDSIVVLEQYKLDLEEAKTLKQDTRPVC